MNIDEAVLMPESKPINFRPRPRSEVNLSYSVQVRMTMRITMMMTMMLTTMMTTLAVFSQCVPLICILVIYGKQPNS